MPNELKPCPYCNGEYVNSPDGHYVHPFNDCDDRGRILQTEDIAWFNQRPLEAALQARIEELEKAAVKWHRFIEGKDEPSESGYYLTLQKISKYHSLVLTEHWVAVPGYWDTKTAITHWAYLPAPPKEGE